jgi:type II secretory pathway component PulF
VFSQRFPLKAMIEHCRGVRHMLSAGLTLVQAMKHQAKSGPAVMRPTMAQVAARLEQGENLPSALREVEHRFPPLYLAIGAVAEETGALPEALRELEDFFAFQSSLWRKFLAQITFPCITFVFATIIVSILIWLLGVINPGQHSLSVFGLTGGSGAMIFFFTVWGFVFAIAAIIFFLRNVVGRGPAVDRFFLSLYALGPTMEALALSRFSLAMSVTVEAGVPIHNAVALSLGATSNYAYSAKAPACVQMLKKGETLAETLKAQRIFPAEFIDIVHTAEVSGKEPDAFARQSKQYTEIAEIRMKILAQAAYWIIWGSVAVFVIILLFHIYGQYISMLNSIK